MMKLQIICTCTHRSPSKSGGWGASHSHCICPECYFPDWTTGAGAGGGGVVVLLLVLVVVVVVVLVVTLLVDLRTLPC